MPPLVSVLCATYNRSAVLRLALDSVLRQSVADLELIVVGDACTDDSEAVVRGLGDDRVRWLNRTVNAGEQSVPNNDGVRLAQGRYLAFLNQDDLWWPDHLERGLQQLERDGSDLVFAFAAAAEPDGSLRPLAASPTGRYERYVATPASTWVLRREAAETHGPWRPARKLLVSPSYDWLVRADRAGCRMTQQPVLSALLVPSGRRPGSYTVAAGADEHHEPHRRITQDPERFREEVCARLALVTAGLGVAPRPVRAHAQAFARDAGYRMLQRTPVTPFHLTAALRYRRRGGFVSHLRRVRGLE